ncbi:MAG: multicopper oxidase domain-containing protein [Acetobacteraceae bacterium]|nr:multicopper oxidase domain-containing protein [Acetobacteraceae bacterium]
MVYLTKDASRRRHWEARKARQNRAEIVKALSNGQITRRDLYKWGLFGLTGALALKNGLSPFARSAFAEVPTGAPPSPTFGATKFRFPLNRLNLQKPVPLTKDQNGNAAWPVAMGEPPAKRLSYHTDFTNFKNSDPTDPTSQNPFVNPATGRGPMEGRPPGEQFAHQRWDEFFPKVGYVLSWARVAPQTRFYNDTQNWPAQDADSVWTYATGQTNFAAQAGTLPPMLIKVRYGEPVLTRVYNKLPDDPDHKLNNGFGRNESQMHLHNAHNGAESDGAANVHHFPGTFYDYRWSTTLARRDNTNTDHTDKRASGPDGQGGLTTVAGDWRELQGTMWAHDHRFFFTAENVYKGNLLMVTFYSGRDRGNETLDDGVNLRLPSGNLLDSGNLDFDVNLIIRDAAFDDAGQLFFDIFDTDGFIGDVMLVNESFAPFFEVLPRKYRFRTLSAGMSRWIRLQLADPGGNAVPGGVVTFIANDGNLLVNPVSLTDGLLPVQGTAERFDIIIDFSAFKPGDRLHLVNVLQHANGLLPKQTVPLGQALSGFEDDPAVGPILEFRVVDQVESVDMPGIFHKASDQDASQVPLILTEQIPIVQTPARRRTVVWGRRGKGDSRLPNGQCIPDCPETARFPWTVKVDNEAAHSMNANRVSLIVPRPGEVEWWTFINDGGGWDHPIHLHFEEGVTMQRNGQAIADPTENLVRKDVWRLGKSGSVTFQVQFGEYGGAYVSHCHNTVHEDFALLMRIQLLTGVPGSPQIAITDTPNPSRDGVVFTTPDILSGANPAV